MRALVRIALAAVLGLGLWIGSSAAPGVASAETTLQVVTVKVKPGKMNAYMAAIKKLNGIMDRLGVKATVRTWRATMAGDATGTVVVGLEHADLAAFADANAKMQGDSEWQKTIAGLDGIRTILSSSLYEEVTP